MGGRAQRHARGATVCSRADGAKARKGGCADAHQLRLLVIRHHNAHLARGRGDACAFARLLGASGGGRRRRTGGTRGGTERGSGARARLRAQRGVAALLLHQLVQGAQQMRLVERRDGGARPVLGLVGTRTDEQQRQRAGVVAPVADGGRAAAAHVAQAHQRLQLGRVVRPAVAQR
jgi:hypothetical protein